MRNFAVGAVCFWCPERGIGRKTCFGCLGEPSSRGNSKKTCYVCPLGGAMAEKLVMYVPLGGAIAEKLALYVPWAGQWQKNLFYMSHGGAMARKQFSHAPASQIGGAIARKQASHAPASKFREAMARKLASHTPADRLPGSTAEKFLSLLKILSNSVILDTEKVCKKVRLPWEENQTS